MSGKPSIMSHSLVPSRSYLFLGVAAVVYRVNTCASVVYQLFAVYFVKVTHGVVTSANCAILLYKSACVYVCVQDVYGILLYLHMCMCIDCVDPP